MRRRTRAHTKEFPAGLRDKVILHLSGLGFSPTWAQCRAVAWQGTAGVVTYDTSQHGARRPYLIVVVLERGAIPGLFGDLSLPNDSLPNVRSSPYLAVTDGSEWAWYRNSPNGADLTPLGEPPPPPSTPRGGRWLEPVRDKRVVKQALQVMSVALRDSHGGGIVERFDVISRLLFAKVFDEREVQEGAKDRYEFQLDPGDTLDSLSQRIGRLWHRACSRHNHLRHGGIPELTDDRAALHRIVSILQDVDLLSTPGDIKGMAYEEILRNTFEKNENQQFFTPHEVVEFMTKLVAPQPGEAVCDPACGTGGFLVEAIRVAGQQAELTGADVDARLVRP